MGSLLFGGFGSGGPVGGSVPSNRLGGPSFEQLAKNAGLSVDDYRTGMENATRPELMEPHLRAVVQATLGVFDSEYTLPLHLRPLEEDARPQGQDFTP